MDNNWKKILWHQRIEVAVSGPISAPYGYDMIHTDRIHFMLQHNKISELPCVRTVAVMGTKPMAVCQIESGT